MIEHTEGTENHLPSGVTLASFTEAKTRELENLSRGKLLDVIENIPESERAFEPMKEALAAFNEQRFAVAVTKFQITINRVSVCPGKQDVVAALRAHQALALWFEDFHPYSGRARMADMDCEIAFRIWSQLGREDLIAESKHTLACMFLIAGNLARAFFYFRSALELALSEKFPVQNSQIIAWVEDYKTSLALLRNTCS